MTTNGYERSPRRKSSLAAEKKMQIQRTQYDSDEAASSSKKKGGRDSSDFEDEGASEGEEDVLAAKKRKRVSTSEITVKSVLDSTIRQLDRDDVLQHAACPPPQRRHTLTYHASLMLEEEHGRRSRGRLLSWFDTVSESRSMPWRKAWLDPNRYDGKEDEFRGLLAVRAYEVWISEIMLQQTRVAVVIDYWNRWMARWPTIEELAKAEQEEVVSAWRGLGYYSRATRIHEAAKKVVNDNELRGLLPATAQDLQAKVPGVGRYTGGAISAIVFGHAAPMVDGNVLRVLSRQLGLLGNVKTNKKVIDYLWSTADALAHAVANDGEDDEAKGALSDRPGRWGQALMELGSTVCTPKPDCSVCPITSTCRAYAEGRLLAGRNKLLTLSASEQEVPTPSVADIEDLCALCEPYESVVQVEEDDAENIPILPPTNTVKRAKAKQATLSSFAFTKRDAKEPKFESLSAVPSAKAMEVIIEHAKRFPVKLVKKAVREEETVVCAIRRSDGCYLLSKRPEKGLLAGLWEFPSKTLADSNDSTATERKRIAADFANDLLSSQSLTSHGEAGSVPWLFSHLKLTMHTQLFSSKQSADADATLPDRYRWASAKEVEAESMGTGMRKCWALVQSAGKWSNVM